MAPPVDGLTPAGDVLRPVQRRAYLALRKAFSKTVRRILLAAPTGFGKTVMLAFLVANHLGQGGRVLVVVHRRELVRQTVDKLRRAGVHHVGIICAGELSDPTAPVQVAMVQTLLARGEFPDATLVVIDEAHHHVAEKWGRVAEHYAEVITIGLTATPERADGTPLGDIFDALVTAASMRELIDLGLLCHCDVIAPPSRTRAPSTDAVTAWFAHAEGRPAVVFARSIAHGREVTDAFVARGIAAAFIDGKTATTDREVTIAAFDRGELMVLVNVFCLTEGWDSPRCEVCILARGCDATGTFLQMVGRVLRPSPDTGKARAQLIDLHGAVHEHGLPDEERVYSLEGRAISSGDAPVKTCLACSHVCPLGCAACPVCGVLFPPADTADDAEPLTSIGREERERGYFLEQLTVARERGWKPGYAAHRFKEKFGRFPAKLWRENFPKEVA